MSLADVAFSTMASPIGTLLLTSDGEALTGVYPQAHRELPSLEGLTRDDLWFSGVRDQLDAYFRGRLTTFDIALALRGTEFQRRVWAQLLTIPCGATRSSLELAVALGKPSGSAAVALAVKKCPILVIVPSHRVVNGAGLPTGDATERALKQWLLAHEASMAAPWPRPSVAPQGEPRPSITR